MTGSSDSEATLYGGGSSRCSHSRTMRLRRPRVGSPETQDQDEMARSILDACRDDAILVLRVGVGLGARDKAGPHPDGVGTERQRCSYGSTIRDATGSDDRDGLDHINHRREQRECCRGSPVVASSLAALHDERLGATPVSGACFGRAANLKPDVAARRPQTR